MANIMTNDGQLRTRDVVVEFLRAYLSRRGVDCWQPRDFKQMEKRWAKDHKHYYNIVCSATDALLYVSEDLRHFMESSQRETKFEAMAKNLSTRIVETRSVQTEAFKAIADEIFREKITWSNIVTFFLYFSEIILRIVDTEENLHSDGEMVNDIIKWMCKYIDRNLVQWINAKTDKWENLYEDPIYVQARRNEAKSRMKPTSKSYFGRMGLAAVAILAGSLYLGSKLAVQ